MNMNFKDYPAEQIAKKLKDVERYESIIGIDTRSKAWRKWCESIEYRKKEWEFRQATVNLYKHNNNIL
jgi:hypothetical protein